MFVNETVMHGAVALGRCAAGVRMLEDRALQLPKYGHQIS